MKRIFLAVLVCRHKGSRLFGKPFQNLDIKENIKVIDNLIDCYKKSKFISKIFLTISNGESNKSFICYTNFKKIQIPKFLKFCDARLINP
jgi:spore coat polysaccharide biosynthesis protein SpsF